VAAYEELVRMHQGIAFRTAYLIAGSSSDAEEAAHDAFVKAFGALGRFRRGEPFRPWLLTIVANEARNRRRSAGRRHALARRAAEEIRPGARPRPPRRLCWGTSNAASSWRLSTGSPRSIGSSSPVVTSSI
jgi:RNA polymerase sigma factor (sigma-70 family)